LLSEAGFAIARHETTLDESEVLPYIKQPPRMLVEQLEQSVGYIPLSFSLSPF